MMGKKKGVKKTKEVSVAIAESTSPASASAEPQTPRKRGRPRKVVVDKDLIKEEKQTQHELQEFDGTDSKKPRIGQEECGDEEDGTNKEKRLEEIKEVVGSSSSNPRKEDEEKESSPKKQQSKSRARKKGKPRKSS